MLNTPPFGNCLCFPLQLSDIPRSSTPFLTTTCIFRSFKYTLVGLVPFFCSDDHNDDDDYDDNNNNNNSLQDIFTWQDLRIVQVRSRDHLIMRLDTVMINFIYILNL